MASPFDNPQWWRKINAAQEAINKALEPSRKLQQMVARLPDQQMARLHEQLFESQRKTAELIRRNLEAVEGPRKALQQNYRQLDKWLKSYDVLETYRRVAEAGRKFEEAWRRALPVNWRERTPDEIAELTRLTVEEGVPLVWVPGVELTAQITRFETRDDTVQFLLAESDHVLDDIEVTLDEVRAEDLRGWAGKPLKAIAADSPLLASRESRSAD